MGGPMRGEGYAARQDGQPDERQPGTANGLEAWLDAYERRIHALEAENQELRRQLAALRHGMGMAVVIEGQTFTLATPTPNPSPVRGRGASDGSVPAPSPAGRGASDGSLPAPSPAARGASGPVPRVAPVPHAPHVPPAPQAVPSLPSMPTSHLLVPSLPATGPRAAMQHASAHHAAMQGDATMQRGPRTGAAEDAWLTAEHPAVAAPRPRPSHTGESGRMPASAPSAAQPATPRPPADQPADGDAWLRSGVAWPDVAPRHPHTPVHPAFPPAPAPTSVPSAQRPVRAPRTNRPDLQQDQAPRERNIYTDSFIL